MKPAGCHGRMPDNWNMHSVPRVADTTGVEFSSWNEKNTWPQTLYQAKTCNGRVNKHHGIALFFSLEHYTKLAFLGMFWLVLSYAVKQRWLCA